APSSTLFPYTTLFRSPADWQGTITGAVNARGGPLTHFFVDDANVVFRDAHVPGAESHVKGRGELDILFPAFTAFHRFSAQTDRRSEEHTSELQSRSDL